VSAEPNFNTKDTKSTKTPRGKKRFAQGAGVAS
jgi:hypothetical protein